MSKSGPTAKSLHSVPYASVQGLVQSCLWQAQVLGTMNFPGLRQFPGNGFPRSISQVKFSLSEQQPQIKINQNIWMTEANNTSPKQTLQLLSDL